MLFQDAEFYSKNSNVQASEAMSLLVSIGLELKNEPLLDIGCGDGKISDCMRQLGAKVTGIDVSKPMIDYAKECFPEVKFFNIDAANIDELCDRFSIITSFNCLHWIKDIDLVLSGVRNKLDGNGIFLGVIYPRCEELWKAAELLETSEEYRDEAVGFSNPYQFHTLTSFKQLLVSAGFSEVDIWQKPRSTTFPNSESFKRYIQGWLPHCKHFSSSFIDDWTKNYCKLTNQQESSALTMSYDAVYFAAQ